MAGGQCFFGEGRSGRAGLVEQVRLSDLASEERGKGGYGDYLHLWLSSLSALHGGCFFGRHVHGLMIIVCLAVGREHSQLAV